MLYNKKLEILDKSTTKDADKSKSFSIIFFCHCLKWYYQNYKQSESWIKNIITSSRNIKTILYKNYLNNKNNATFTKAADLLHDAYLKGKGIENAIKETGVLDITKDTNVWKEFCTLEVICNEEYIRKWLIFNAYSFDIIDKINNKK